MTGTAPLFEQYFKEHQPVSPKASIHCQSDDSDMRSLRVGGSSEILSIGQMRLSSGSRTAAVSGRSRAWNQGTSFSGTHELSTTARHLLGTISAWLSVRISPQVDVDLETQVDRHVL